MRILIVEDEVAIREVEVAYLRKAGYATTEVDNGEEALSQFGMDSFDLVLLDINLPGMSGLELCRKIRSISGVPIVLVTARNEDMDELLGLDGGADLYIRKPFRPEILLARVQALLRRVGTTKIANGPFVLDPETRQVFKNGRQLAMTSTQFNIFYHLIAHPGRVFTRNQLMEVSHGENESQAVFDRTIDAHIKMIRKHVEERADKPTYIQTVIGYGYCYKGRPDA